MLKIKNKPKHKNR